MIFKHCENGYLSLFRLQTIRILKNFTVKRLKNHAKCVLAVMLPSWKISSKQSGTFQLGNIMAKIFCTKIFKPFGCKILQNPCCLMPKSRCDLVYDVGKYLPLKKSGVLRKFAEKNGAKFWLTFEEIFFVCYFVNLKHLFVLWLLHKNFTYLTLNKFFFNVLFWIADFW